MDLILRFITVKFLEELGCGIIEAKDATAAWAKRVEKITFGDYSHKVEILVCRSQTQQPTGSSTPKACMIRPFPSALRPERRRTQPSFKR